MIRLIIDHELTPFGAPPQVSVNLAFKGLANYTCCDYHTNNMDELRHRDLSGETAIVAIDNETVEQIEDIVKNDPAKKDKVAILWMSNMEKPFVESVPIISYQQINKAKHIASFKELCTLPDIEPKKPGLKDYLLRTLRFGKSGPDVF